jgi:ABC-type multidrug transport system ATPase subunit
LRHAAKRARVEELLRAVDGGALADARVGALSGGEQQKVLIAHALARQPRLLLLDEPLANLDLRSTRETVRLLGRIATEHKVAVLLSTHDMNPLIPVMDRVIYLAAGRAASGTVDEVVRSEVLSQLYGHHVDAFRAHGRVIVSVGEEHREDGCETGPDEPRPGPGTSTAVAGHDYDTVDHEDPPDDEDLSDHEDPAGVTGTDGATATVAGAGGPDRR